MADAAATRQVETGSEAGENAVTEASQQQRQLGRSEKAVAIFLIAGFAVMVAVMFYMRNDMQWERMVFLFGSVEALVFGAAGALFGTSIQRSHVADAQEAAEQAKKEATEGKAAAERAAQTEKKAAIQSANLELLRTLALEKERHPAHDVGTAANLSPESARIVTADALKRDLDQLIRSIREIPS